MRHLPKTVGVIGGGLAGLAAAAVLCRRGLQVELFERKPYLGGRAGSCRDRRTGRLIDRCRHVAMGCCTGWLDFCRRTGIDALVRRDTVLHLFGPDGRRCDLSAAGWLPAPLRLGPSLLTLGFLTPGERLGVAKTLVQLAREKAGDADDRPSVGRWLRERGQSEQAIHRFWSVILVSALGETVDRISLPVARKVFVEGFLAARDAHHLLIPTVPLGKLLDCRVGDWLTGHGVKLHRAAAVERLDGDARGVTTVRPAGGTDRRFDFVVVAVPWHRLRAVLSETLAAAMPRLAAAGRIEGSPITGVHLWLDRPITRLRHAVLVGRLAQWVFRHDVEPAAGAGDGPGHHYQAVVSASRELAGRERSEVLREIHDDLKSIWPEARRARLLGGRVFTRPDAVFSPRPGVERLRVPQTTPVAGLFLAGDWTRTGWPATMESAIRSGYLAADAVLHAAGIYPKR